MLNLPPVDRKEKDEEEFVPDYLYERKDIPALFTTSSKTFGAPGASLTWGINGQRNTGVITAGKEGENQTAKIIDAFCAKTPDAYAFHSLRWPESNGDTDHIICFKDLIIVIDSKRWKGSRKYSITAKGEIKRGTVPFPEGKVKIGYALKTWRKKLSSTKVFGVVAIAQEKVFVVRDANWYKAPYRLVEAEKLEAHLADLVKKHKPEHTKQENIHTLHTLAGYLVKPRDPRAGLIQGTTDNPFSR